MFQDTRQFKKLTARQWANRARKATEEIRTKYPPAQAIGRFKNLWRQRTVDLFDHPTDPNLVITVGYPFDNSAPVVCEENRHQFARFIGGFNGIWE